MYATKNNTELFPSPTPDHRMPMVPGCDDAWSVGWKPRPCADTRHCRVWRVTSVTRDVTWRWGPASASPRPSPSSSSTPPPASSSGSGPAARMTKCERRKLLCLPEPCTFKCQKISNLLSWDAGCALYLHQYLMNDPEVNNNAFIVYRILHAGYVTFHV